MGSELEVVLDDLCSRFLINCPEEEYESLERICFQIEQAHWFYEDFYREKNPRLPSLSLKEFTRQIFERSELLKQVQSGEIKSTDEILANFKKYKFRVPVFGAIILNPSLDKCLLVKGWHSRSSWGFPKGKINKLEPEIDCAAREVYEETGFNIKDLVKEEDHIEMTVREQRIKLYIIPGVPETTHFAPRTRKEISKIEWHNVSDLPGYSKKNSNNNNNSKDSRLSGNQHFLISPFVSKLKGWIRAHKKLIGQVNTGPSSYNRTTTTSIINTSTSVTLEPNNNMVAMQQQQQPTPMTTMISTTTTTPYDVRALTSPIQISDGGESLINKTREEKKRCFPVFRFDVSEIERCLSSLS
eukprot:TRINITY_DN2796_c0_g4_i1.p1 TRINITY_DN2796_c0_g4~~TRINITY_DN2796_c0_g4_i1.p1  ORF type:complete len:356 (-),score=78.99 TRINITY_DN2796_c0_g4_i1:1050-2117(-)